MIITGYYKPIVGQCDLTSFDFSWLVLPWICPKLHVSGQGLRHFLAEIVQQYGFLTVVAVPPFVLQLLICLWPVLASISSLPASWETPKPQTLLLLFPRWYLLMHLGNVLQLENVLHVNICWDRVQFPSLCILLDLFPVGLVIPLNWLLTKLPWTIDSRVLFHAITVCTIVNLHLLEVTPLAILLESRDTGRCRKVEKILNVDRSVCTFL